MRFILLMVIALNTVPTSAQRQASFEAFITGVRPNAVKGDVLYQRGDGKFDLEPGLRLEEGDFIKSSVNSYAELLLQPGNYLRVGGETECQIFSAEHDKMRFKLNKGTISLEILATEWEDTIYSRKEAYQLIRVITPNAQVFISEPGIFRINAVTRGRTELIVRNGEAVINGRRVKKNRSAVASGDSITVAEIDSKSEDSFDLWGRERADKLVHANRMLKNESPWTDKRKDGEKTSVDFPEEEETRLRRGVVSVRPGTVNFVESGVELSRPTKEWEQLPEKSELETGDRLRTNEHSFVEIAVLPDMHLRLDQSSEALFEQLSTDSISVKLLRGSAILNVAQFDSKEGLPLTFGGPSTSVVIAEEGNYRIDITPSGEEITVREGKVMLKEKSVNACRRIAAGTISDCDKKKRDTFDAWSEYRGEGEYFQGKRVVPVVYFLTDLRRVRFRKTGFWFQNPGQTTYTFVPFTSPHFRSPYGGNYSTVLTPPKMRMNRVDPRDDPFSRLPGLAPQRPRP